MTDRDWLFLSAPQTMRDLLKLVARRTGQSEEEIKGRTLYHPVSVARHEFMWLARRTGRYSLPQIGAFLGGRHHTTVLHGIRQHVARLDGKRDYVRRAA